MCVLVADRESIEQGFPVRSSYVLISIRDSDATRARVPKVAGLEGVLHLAFDDAEPAGSFQLPANIRLMTKDQARRIWRFVRFHRDRVGAFVVHCHQSMSRSPAVAAAISSYLKLVAHDAAPHPEYMKSDPRFWANFDVFDSLF